MLYSTMLKFTYTDNDRPVDILDFLLQYLPVVPVSYWRKLLRGGKIVIDGETVSTSRQLQLGETVELPESRRLLELIEQQQRQPHILYESREILILHKPAGLACHSSRGHEQDNLTDRAISLLKHRGETFRVAPCHRLDLQTSGPVLFGKGKKALSLLGTLMQSDQVTKRYFALVPGGLPESGRLSGQLPCKGKTKKAETLYRTIARNTDACLLELELKTGRQHQIRRQLADLGVPIFGDSRYRGDMLSGLDRMFLHCHRLSFPSPFTGELITIDDPLPEPLQQVLEQFSLGGRQQLDNCAARS